MIEFNTELKNQLQDLVYEIPKEDPETIKKMFGIKANPFQNILLFIPAVIGFVIHAPFYYATILIIKDRAKDHFDSIVIGIFFLFYPIYISLFALIAFLITSTLYSLLLLLIMPLTALCLLHFKPIISKTKQ